VKNWNFGLPGRGSEEGKFCSEYVQGPLIYPLPNRLLLNRAELSGTLLCVRDHPETLQISAQIIKRKPFRPDISRPNPNPPAPMNHVKYLRAGPAEQNHVCICALAHRRVAFAAGKSRSTQLRAYHKLLLVAPTFARVFILLH